LGSPLYNRTDRLTSCAGGGEGIEKEIIDPGEKQDVPRGGGGGSTIGRKERTEGILHMLNDQGSREKGEVVYLRTKNRKGCRGHARERYVALVWGAPRGWIVRQSES